jgi:hypothetical protein
MYYWLPPSMGRAAGLLRFVVTEWNVCHECGHQYRGNHCTGGLGGAAICNQPFDPQQSRRTAREWLILLGGPIRFERHARLRCSNRREHFCKAPLPVRARFFEQLLGAEWERILGAGWEYLAPADLDAVLPRSWDKKLGDYWDNLYPLTDDFENWRTAKRLVRDDTSRARARTRRAADSELGDPMPEVSDDEFDELSPETPDSAPVEVPPAMSDSEFVELLRAKSEAFRSQCACPICGQEPSNKAKAKHVWGWP